MHNTKIDVQNNIGALLAYWDTDLLCHYANSTYAEWFGYTQDQIVGKMKLRDLLGEELFQTNYHHIAAVLAGEPQQFERELNVASGGRRPALISYYPHIVDGVVLGFYVHVADISLIRSLEGALKTAESKFNTLLNAAPDALVVLGADLTIDFANAQAEKMLGYANGDLLGKPFDTLVAPHSKVHILPIAETGRSYTSEIILVDVNNNDIPAEITVNHVSLGGNEYYNIAARDISERKAQEQALRRMADIIEMNSDAIISKTIDGTITTWNKGAEKILGYTAEEAIGRNIAIIFPDELKDEEMKLTEAILKGEKVQQYETTRLRKDGKEIHVSITLSAITDKEGAIVGLAKILRDITERKRAEQAFRELEERNRIFVAQAPNAIAMLDKDMKYLAASQRWLEDYRLQGQQIIGKSHYEIFPEIGDDWKQIHRECLAGAVNKCDEAIFKRADGTVQWLQWVVQPWYAADYKIGGIIMFTADITEQKERELQRNKMQYILEASSKIAKIASWEVNAQDGSVVWGGMANQIFEVPGDFVPDSTNVPGFYKAGKRLDTLLAAMKESISNGTPYDLEAEIITGKGNHKWLRIIGEAEMKNGQCIRRYGLFQDITHAKSVELELQRLNDDLTAILNSGHVSIIGTSLTGTIIHFNKGAEILLGYTAEEVVGKRQPDFIHKREEIQKRAEELTAQLGSPVAGIDVFVEMARRGDFDSREWTYVRKDGSTFPVQLVMTAIKNREGEATGFLGIAIDITELKEAKSKLESVLDVTVQQNERLKNFAHIVSHNLRSHSGNISMLIELMGSEHPEMLTNEYYNMLKTSGVNLKETIANLNEVVLINTATYDKLDALNLYDHAVAAIGNVRQLAINAGVDIENNIDRSLRIQGIKAYADSIILNLLTNAIKYRANDRKSYVRLNAREEGDYVVLSVEDNGLGIDLARNRSKLFGLYKTFHAHAEARGVGLFITKNQVEATGGKIDVESQVNVGSTFKIYFKNAES